MYNQQEQKVRKIEWHDNQYNPKELLLEIEKEAVELEYYYEFPNGLFRKTIRHYHPKVIRELLLNAFAHLSAYLQLTDEERLRSYVVPLLNFGLINKRGTGKGTVYFVNPKLIANSKANVKTTLKNIEPYTLKALIIEDLKMHPKSLMSEILSRLPDVELNDLRNTVYKMVGDELIANGGRTYRRYELNDGRKEIEKKMGKRIV